MKKEDGIKEIDETQWELDKWGCLNLRVHDENGNLVHAFLQMRNSYCDRGHICLNIDIPSMVRMSMDGFDSFPRFFFSLEEAQKHAKLFLKWRIWKHREITDYDLRKNFQSKEGDDER